MISQLRRCVFIVSVVLLVVPMQSESYFVNYEHVNTSGWGCHLCEFDYYRSPTGSLVAQLISSSDGHARFGRENGIDDPGIYHLVDLETNYFLSDSLAASVQARSLGSSTNNIRLTAGQHSKYNLFIRHRESPNNESNEGRSPFELRGNQLVLAENWVGGSSTQSFERLGTLSVPVYLRTVRRETDLGFWYRITPQIVFESTRFYEEKSGIDDRNVDAYFQSTVMPIPVSSEVTGWRSKIRIESKPLMATLKYEGRTFNNTFRSLQWQSPYSDRQVLFETATDPSTRFKSVYFDVSGTLNDRTVIHWNGERSWSRQLEANQLNFSSDPDLGWLPTGLEETNLKIVFESMTIKLIRDFLHDLQVSFMYQEKERSDHRPNIVLQPVVGDLFRLPETTALGYSGKFQQSRLQAQYDPSDHVRLVAGIDLITKKRTNLEIAVNKSRKLWIDAIADVDSRWHLGTRCYWESRNASPFIHQTPNNPLTRRFYQAAREQRKCVGSISSRSRISRLSWSLNAEWLENEYPESKLGLVEDSLGGFALMLAINNSPNMTFEIWLEHHERRSVTRGHDYFDVGNWQYETDDYVSTVSVQYEKKRFLLPSVNLSIQMVASDGVGKYRSGTSEHLGHFSDLISRHRSYDLQIQYLFSENRKLALQYYFEQYRSEDWAKSDLTQDSLRNVLSFSQGTPTYTNQLISLKLESTFF